MRRANLVWVLMATLMSSGCGVIEAEQTYRGGFANKVTDDALLPAETKAMRVLRSAAILSVLTHVATSTIQGEDAINAASGQIKTAASDIGVAWEVALTKTHITASSSDGYDGLFDLRMKMVIDDLFRVAALSLPHGELKRLVTDMETTNWLDGLFALWKVTMNVADAARWGFAGYRDLVDANGAILIANGVSLADYKAGEGPLSQYAPEVTAAITRLGTAINVVESDFKPWFKAMVLTCKRAGWDRITDVKTLCDDTVVAFQKGRGQYTATSVAVAAVPPADAAVPPVVPVVVPPVVSPLAPLPPPVPVR